MNISSYLLELPSYIASYIIDEQREDHISEKTSQAFAYDFTTFFSYLLTTSMDYPSIKEIPLRKFLSLKERDLAEYRDFLIQEKKLSSNTVLRKLSTLHRFYLYLHRKGLTDVCPTVFLTKPQASRNNKVLSEKQILRLLSGVRSNTKLLLKTDAGPVVAPISRKARLKREKCVPRNLAILTLFLETGITIGEMAALDIDDFDATGKCLHIPSRKEYPDLPLDKNAYESVHFYLYGEGVPKWFFEKYPDNKELYTFCRTHMDDEDIRILAAAAFHRSDAIFLDDVEECARHWRRAGREAFSPKDPLALFLSTRGTRLSVRSIQNLVADLTYTYIGIRCTPHMLRITKEAELLAEKPAEAYLFMNKKSLKPGNTEYSPL